VSVEDLKLYYVMEYIGKNIFVYNEYWEYQRTITPPSNEYPSSGPIYSININGSIFVTSSNVINKYDNYLNLTKQVSSPGSSIYYNSANQMIYVAKYSSNSINVYDKDLNFIRTISTNYWPLFITEYNGQMVVTDTNSGNIYLYQGESLFRTVSTFCTSGITSVLFDNNNQMIVSCLDSNIYIYNVDGTYTGLKVTACNSNLKYFVNFDSKDRLVVVCRVRVEIFY
jgi:hypothetical protein